MEAMTRETASEIYRGAWSAWLLTSRERDKLRLQVLMDSVQPVIALSPKDPAWQAFASTLPGFLDFWSGLDKRMVAEARRARGGR